MGWNNYRKFWVSFPIMSSRDRKLHFDCIVHLRVYILHGTSKIRSSSATPSTKSSVFSAWKHDDYTNIFHLIRLTRQGFSSGCGCRRVLPGMGESRECVCHFWIIDKVYLPVQFLGGDVTFPCNKNTLVKLRT